MRKFLLFSVVLFLTAHAGAQSQSNLRSRLLSISADTIQIDTLSLVPRSFYILDRKNQLLDTAAYRMDEISGVFSWNKKS
ncbi:MAG TPA: hypothetical protein PLU53_11720, partial [Bacteroidia bacterium]|nr:hypothetical protein [Bacteroidia bacterium]